MDEPALLARIAESRDQAAFEALARSYAGRLLGFMRGRGVSDPEGLTQEVLLTMWRRAGTFDPSRGSVASWLFTIARNRAYDDLRRHRRPAPDPADPSFVAANATTSIEAPDDAIDRALRREKVGVALHHLPEAQREVIEGVCWRGMTFDATARSLGLAVGTAKSRFRLGIAALRAQLSAEDNDA